MRIRTLCLMLVFCWASHASVVAVGLGAFSGGPQVDFTGLADNLEVNGLMLNGVQFSYTVGGSSLNGAVVIDNGPGITNNISPQNLVSVGDNTGILSLLLPTPATLFGFGYAILNTTAVANAVTVNVFMGTSNVGTLSYNGTPDPTFTGGFAGLQSTIAFNRVELTFNSTLAPAFAADNIRFAGGSVSAVPEPSTLLLAVSAIALGMFRRRR